MQTMKACLTHAFDASKPAGSRALRARDVLKDCIKNLSPRCGVFYIYAFLPIT